MNKWAPYDPKIDFLPLAPYQNAMLRQDQHGMPGSTALIGARIVVRMIV